MTNRVYVRIHIVTVQVTPISARMSPHQTNRIDIVAITEGHGCSGDDNLSEFKKRHGDVLTLEPWAI